MKLNLRSMAVALFWLVAWACMAGCGPRRQPPELPYDAESIPALRDDLDEFSG